MIKINNPDELEVNSFYELKFKNINPAEDNVKLIAIKYRKRSPSVAVFLDRFTKQKLEVNLSAIENGLVEVFMLGREVEL